MRKTNNGYAYTKTWPRKNLGELLNFLERMHPEGLSLKALSEKIGITPGAVSNLFIHDDMKLSRAEEIARRYGYELHLYFPVRTFNGIVRPPEHGMTFEGAGNLRGLMMYIYDSNWSVNYVARNMGIWPAMLFRAMKTGDILISNLYKVADSMDIVFHWEWEPIRNDLKDMKS